MGEQLEALEQLLATLKVAKDEQIGEEHLARFRADAAYRKRVAAVMRNGGLSVPSGHLFNVPQHYLRMFGRDEWSALFVIDMFAKRYDAPWPEWDLNAACPFWPNRRIHETHFLFLGIDEVYRRESSKVEVERVPMPLTIPGLVRLTTDLAHWRNRPKMWRTNRMVDEGELGYPSRTTPTLRWYLMPIVPVGRFDDGLPDGYEGATAAEYLLALILYYQKYGIWHENSAHTNIVDYPAICADDAEGYEGERLVVRLDKETRKLGVETTHFRETSRWSRTGMAVSRKLPTHQ